MQVSCFLRYQYSAGFCCRRRCYPPQLFTLLRALALTVPPAQRRLEIIHRRTESELAAPCQLSTEDLQRLITQDLERLNDLAGEIGVSYLSC